MGIQISFSAADKYLLSPMQYFLHYLLKLRPIQLSSPLIFGSAIDSGLNHLLYCKKTEFKNLEQKYVIINQKNALDSAKKNFIDTLKGSEVDYRVHGAVKFSKADLDESLLEGLDIPDGHDRAWYSLREKGLIMLEAYAEQVLPKIKEVHAVQHEIKVTNTDGDTFIGVVDFIATMENGQKVLMDNKTTSVPYKDDAIDNSSQLASYWEILKDEYQLDAVGFCIIPKNIRKRKEPKCEIKIMIGQVKEDLIHQTFLDYDKVLHGIKTAQFACSGNCQKQFWKCPYQNYCATDGKDTSGLCYQERKK